MLSQGPEWETDVKERLLNLKFNQTFARAMKRTCLRGDSEEFDSSAELKPYKTWTNINTFTQSINSEEERRVKTLFALSLDVHFII